MNGSLRFALACLPAVALLSPALAQGLPNDTCDVATPISGTGQWIWNNAQASSSGFVGGDPANCSPASGMTPPQRDVFFRWTALADGTRQFHTCSSMIDSAINVHLGGDCNATCLTSNDSGSCGPVGQSAVTIEVTAGTEYLVQLGEWGFNLPALNYTLDVIEPSPGGVLMADVRYECLDANEAFITVAQPPLADTEFLRLSVNDAPELSFGMFLVAPTEAGTPTMTNLGQGILCLGSSVGRYGPAMAAAKNNRDLNSICQFFGGFLFNAVGTGAGGFGFSVPRELPFAGPTQTIASGDSYSFQYWYRTTDGSGVATSHVSSMVVVEFL